MSATRIIVQRILQWARAACLWAAPLWALVGCEDVPKGPTRDSQGVDGLQDSGPIGVTNTGNPVLTGRRVLAWDDDSVRCDQCTHPSSSTKGAGRDDDAGTVLLTEDPEPSECDAPAPQTWDEDGDGVLDPPPYSDRRRRRCLATCPAGPDECAPGPARACDDLDRYELCVDLVAGACASLADRGAGCGDAWRAFACCFMRSSEQVLEEACQQLAQDYADCVARSTSCVREAQAVCAP